MSHSADTFVPHTPPTNYFRQVSKSSRRIRNHEEGWADPEWRVVDVDRQNKNVVQGLSRWLESGDGYWLILLLCEIVRVGGLRELDDALSVVEEHQRSPLHVLRGICFDHLEDASHAIAEFDCALTLDPKNVKVRRDGGVGEEELLTIKGPLPQRIVSAALWSWRTRRDKFEQGLEIGSEFIWFAIDARVVLWETR